jgi:hypothetical protein
LDLTLDLVRRLVGIDKVISVWPQSAEMVGKYDIDFLDAFQLVVTKHGQFRHMVAGSRTISSPPTKTLR